MAAFTPAADEITALVPGPPNSEGEIKITTSTDVTSFSPLPIKVYPKRNMRLYHFALVILTEVQFLFNCFSLIHKTLLLSG